jgi:hypothetical protein
MTLIDFEDLRWRCLCRSSTVINRTAANNGAHVERMVTSNLVRVSLWKRRVLPLASGLVMVAALVRLYMSYGFFVEERGMRQITGLFGQYVAAGARRSMARNLEQFRYGAACAGSNGY